MFVGSQKFPGQWGRNFVGGAIKINLIDIKQMIVYQLLEMLIGGQGLPMKATNFGLLRTMMIPQYVLYTICLKLLPKLVQV